MEIFVIEIEFRCSKSSIKDWIVLFIRKMMKIIKCSNRRWDIFDNKGTFICKNKIDGEWN